MSQVQYPNPFAQDHLVYGQLLREENATKVAAMSAHLRSKLGDLRGISLAVTGSHARLEAGIGSNLETIIFCTTATEKDERVAQAIALVAPMRTPSETEEATPDDNFEIKNVDAHTMYRYCNKPQSTFPGRVTASTFLHGDETLYSMAKNKLYAELRGPDGADVLRALRTRAKGFYEVMTTGIQRFNQDTTLKHFDLAEGVAFYDPREKFLGIKAGPLRYLQVRILRDTIRAARAADADFGRQLIFETPEPLTDRIGMLTELGVTGFNPKQCSTIRDTYSYFLAEYHRQQERYWRHGERKITFDRNETAERLREFTAILEATLVVPQK